MANSKIIGEIKDKVVKLIISDDELIAAIDAPDQDNENWEPIYLLDSADTEKMGFVPHVFREIQNPNVITDAITFIAMEVQIPTSYNDNFFVKSQLEIWIVSHNKHKRVDNIPGIRDSRNDYISMLLDQKLNGDDIGLGQLELIYNEAGIYDDNFIYRKMKFEATDFNDSECDYYG